MQTNLKVAIETSQVVYPKQHCGHHFVAGKTKIQEKLVIEYTTKNFFRLFHIPI